MLYILVEEGKQCGRLTQRHIQRAEPELCKEKIGDKGSSTFKSQGKKYTVTLLVDGVGRDIECMDDEYILDAAERQDIELPYTCRSGICGSCVARVAQGQVDQSDVADISFTLEPEEVEQGMALLCMSRASSDVVIETQCDWGYSLGVDEWKGATGKSTAVPNPLMGTKWGEDHQQ
eukprot:TRINITY_DN12178_c0_g1_i1.p1 TRINITY_DN12178_c0_g1~~TRINITY_DN12178_c0_g1_i1.p1  ORF type:complete len:193 (+),score=31.45 TRINITY_DN12178_c0_g1_i1:54-581(+)